MDTPKIAVSRSKIADFCRRWKVRELSLFGSVLREDFHPDSDVDVLVTFKPDVRVSLFDLIRMEEELTKFFCRQVDLVERAAVENSEFTFAARAY